MTERQIQPNLWLLPEKGEGCGEGLVPRCASGLLQCELEGCEKKATQRAHAHAHACTHEYTSAHRHAHTCVHTHRYMCVHRHMHTHACTHRYMRVHRHTRTETRAHGGTHRYVHTRACTHEHMYTQMHTQAHTAVPRLWPVVSCLTALAQPPAGSPRQCTDAGWGHVWELTRDQLFQKVRVKFPCLEDCFSFLQFC